MDNNVDPSQVAQSDSGQHEGWSFGIGLHRVREELIRHIQDEFAHRGFDISFNQYRAMRVIAELRIASPSEVARRIEHDAGALTRILDRLSAKGYIRREHRADDRRVVDVVLTEQGQAIFTDLARCVEGVLLDALADLDEVEREQLVGLMKRIRGTLEERAVRRAKAVMP